MNATRARLLSPHYVYQLLSGSGALLYIGCTYNLHKRFGEHRREQPWFPQVATIHADLYPDAAQGFAAEAAAHQEQRALYSKNPFSEREWAARIQHHPLIALPAP